MAIYGIEKLNPFGSKLTEIKSGGNEVDIDVQVPIKSYAEITDALNSSTTEEFKASGILLSCNIADVFNKVLNCIDITGCLRFTKYIGEEATIMKLTSVYASTEYDLNRLMLGFVDFTNDHKIVHYIVDIVFNDNLTDVDGMSINYYVYNATVN